MSPDATPQPSPRQGDGLPDLYDISRLAERLGVEHATVRVWLSRKVPWLPLPDGRLNGGAVWRASTLEDIETRRVPGRPGPKPRRPAPVTGAIPLVPPAVVPPVVVPPVIPPPAEGPLAAM